MSRKHGVTAETYKRFAIDQGAIYRNYGKANELLLGATRGGSTFTIEQDIRVMPVDGAKGDVKGSRRVVSVRPLLVANFIELSKDVLQLALPGSSVADYPTTGTKTHDQLTRKIQIALSDYWDNITIVGECSGSPTGYIECGVLNALSEGNFELAYAENDESVLTINIRGHFDPDDLDAEPWFVRFPEIPES